jgi:presqualene diphosphate synthase
MSETTGVARRSSFYTAMRILPQDKRQAMYEIYGFCRAVDDIADDMGRPREERRRELQIWRDEIDGFYTGRGLENHPSLVKTIRAYDLKREDFQAIIDGMEMDVVEDIRAPDRPTFDLYCDRVACAVGRLSTQVFGLDRKTGEALADHLGRALQTTNILRDLDEDAGYGRLYLPADALAKAGIASNDPATVLAHPNLAAAAQALAAEARWRFEKAREVMAACPRAKVRAPRLMGAVYRMILDRLEKRGFAPPREKVSASRLGVLFVLLREMF